MAHDGDAIAVDDTEAHAFVNGGFGGGDQLFDVGIVGFGVAFADDGNGGAFEDSEALGDERNG